MTQNPSFSNAASLSEQKEKSQIFLYTSKDLHITYTNHCFVLLSASCDQVLSIFSKRWLCFKNPFQYV